MEQPKNNLKIVTNKKANARVILPNMLTLIGVCIGLSSIRFALDGKFEFAIIAIILAADMARAVDPSGRLSNQDFEVIYNSLFKTPGTPQAFTAAMAQVRHEMLKQKEQELSNLANEGVNGIEGFLALSKYMTTVKKSLHKTFIKILLLYIEILEKKGILGAKPYLNYLSNELNLFIFN